MLWDASAINGYEVQASDGPVGHVSDLLFDDGEWKLRWLVVDTRAWPLRNSINIPISAVGQPDPALKRIPVRRTIEQLQGATDPGDSPDTDLDQHLHSLVQVIGYSVQATDGAIGHVENTLVEETDQTIRFMTVHTGSWWPSVKVLIAPDSISGISKHNAEVTLDLDRQAVRDARVFDPTTTVDGIQDAKYLTYFGIRWVEQ